MIASRHGLSLVLLAILLGPMWGARADDPGGRQPVSDRLELALHYDFFLGEGTRVNDASGKKRDGTLVHGQIIEGRRRNAVKLDGLGMIRVEGPTAGLDPTARAFTVGAVCNPGSPDGVIASLGDRGNGFCLYLEKGIPHFAVRAGGRLTNVADTEPVALDQWTHLIGGIDESGEVWLIVNGFLTAHARGKFLPKLPGETLCIGADPGSPVDDGPPPAPWRGLLQEVRLYWGFLDLKANREVMKDWADLSGCGCK
jgi:hypothetical protein